MRVRAVLVLTLLSWSVCPYALGRGGAADQRGANPPTAQPAKHYPDEGLLSNYRYANAFFGFSIDLPSDAALRPIPSSNPSDGSIALLETIGSAPHKSVMAISAYASGDKGPNARLLLRRELDDEADHRRGRAAFADQDQHRRTSVLLLRNTSRHRSACDLRYRSRRLRSSFHYRGTRSQALQQLEAAVTHMRFFLRNPSEITLAWARSLITGRQFPIA